MNMANLLRDAVAASPDKCALDDGRATFSYQELEGLSDNFAAYLLSGGLRPATGLPSARPRAGC